MTHQRTPTTDHSDASVTADLKIGACQAAGLPEPLKKTPGTIVIATGQGKNPAGVGAPIGEGEADFLAEPGLQLDTKLKLNVARKRIRDNKLVEDMTKACKMEIVKILRVVPSHFEALTAQ